VNAAPENLQGDRAAAKPRAKGKVVSIAEKQKPEKIRVELNVEKWPALWRPAKAKGAPVVRTLERPLVSSDGVRGTSKLEIGFTQFGTTTTEDQRMFYALIRQWEETGKPADRPVFFSDRLLARLLHKKGWGTNVIEAITESLRRLRTTPLRWINSYHRNDGSGKVVQEETLFNFLEQLKIVTRREHGHVTNQQGYFQFDRNILANLLANYTKPLLDEEFFKLQTEIGQLIYTHVDLVMADKTRYERCTKDLFDDFGLMENPSYRYASNRKQALQKPVAELRGKRLSTGELKSIAIERTKDGKDYKLIFIKGKVTAVAEELPAAEPVVVNHYKLKDQRLLEAEQLVGYFHQRFHGVENTEPLQKELDQASALIAKYGFEEAKHVVGYAFAKAQDTNFRIQHFGGVLNYASRAVAQLERQRQEEERAKATMEQQTRQLEAEQEQQARGEARLAALTAEQYKARFEQAQAELYAQFPKLAQFVRGREGSQIHEGMIRTRMIRKLEHEDMDLLVITAESKT
jgi:hypothetical protein